jgi:hypothetical protein
VDATYPDATFTPRLSFGAVKGYRGGAVAVEPFTTIAGAFERHTGSDQFTLPNSWISARPRLHLETPMNFVTTNDIIGGNSGSPVVNRNGEIVGLVFDGSTGSLGDEYGFDEGSQPHGGSALGRRRRVGQGLRCRSPYRRTRHPALHCGRARIGEDRAETMGTGKQYWDATYRPVVTVR